MLLCPCDASLILFPGMGEWWRSRTMVSVNKRCAYAVRVDVGSVGPGNGPGQLWLDVVLIRGVTIRLATIRYISRYTTHDMVHDTIQNQLIYYQWKILKHCGMCHQYCYIKTVILARNSEFKINKDLHNHPCPKYQLLTNCVCKQNNKIS